MVDRLSELVERLLSDTFGRTFVLNAMNHIELGHLDEQVFADAWRHVVSNSTPTPRDARGVISGVEKWPGRLGEIYAYRPTWLQGCQKPAILDDWHTVEIAHVLPTERLEARLDADARLSADPEPRPNPTARKMLFLLWLTAADKVPIGTTVDRTRDMLGLVHHTMESNADLTLITFPPGALSGLVRPTVLDAGINSRFCGVSQEEWDAWTTNPGTPCMGFTADLERIRMNCLPYTGVPEAVTIADKNVIARRHRVTRLGKVTIEEADDRRYDRRYEAYLQRAHKRLDMKNFLERFGAVTT